MCSRERFNKLMRRPRHDLTSILQSIRNRLALSVCACVCFNQMQYWRRASRICLKWTKKQPILMSAWSSFISGFFFILFFHTNMLPYYHKMDHPVLQLLLSCANSFWPSTTFCYNLCESSNILLLSIMRRVTTVSGDSAPKSTSHLSLSKTCQLGCVHSSTSCQGWNKQGPWFCLLTWKTGSSLEYLLKGHICVFFLH